MWHVPTWGVKIFWNISFRGGHTPEWPCKMGDEEQGKRQGRRETYVFLKLQETLWSVSFSFSSNSNLLQFWNFYLDVKQLFLTFSQMWLFSLSLSQYRLWMRIWIAPKISSVTFTLLFSSRGYCAYWQEYGVNFMIFLRSVCSDVWTEEKFFSPLFAHIYMPFL
jgi:hypothetical protein